MEKHKNSYSQTLISFSLSVCIVISLHMQAHRHTHLFKSFWSSLWCRVLHRSVFPWLGVVALPSLSQTASQTCGIREQVQQDLDRRTHNHSAAWLNFSTSSKQTFWQSRWETFINWSWADFFDYRSNLNRLTCGITLTLSWLTWSTYSEQTHCSMTLSMSWLFSSTNLLSKLTCTNLLASDSVSSAVDSS